ncbi:WD repeat domain phosphoinositide-interacting protein 2-like isoform X2 [Varroa jacobsoni]|uniref:WD repeat domain phosphoinositide-interacting protein 2 n=1 Tax=Varroa destructor TaxID=109461 RepID=A0A7M7KFY6_VARDE|nr:WD repeat domain phosphoinositide-interacting protein 2-like isoform X2 [Varroa destructor]XP_022666246.1 WD repeat domain phosphoinositide-interacting protein 2-like isoform X2 [Varroa destructor]XP_022693593.1 WD repeat domain phosphoinositide-interacting protein 2-like isoform X2 [Varroa jacobsoni]XP_022693594.1 WD repeat domain phosphoinositide-interacting protein 2-like isoform X2 [Varroa jacobsoni]
MAFMEGGGCFKNHSIFVNFNQDFTSLAVGTNKGYRLFALNSVDRLEKIHQSADCEDVALVERLFSSSLVAVVSLPSSRKLKVCHFKKGTEITSFSYANTILAVKLNRSRVVVCLEESLYIHNIRDMKVLHTIRDTPANPKGVCALSSNTEKGVTYLAYPGSTSMGEIQIFDTENICAKIMIPAHNSPLAALAFNANGSLLASASEKGTVIRVFSVNDGSRIYELRRGLKRCATIYSLAFNVESTLLACASNFETVHIFKLDENSASGGSSGAAGTPQATVGSLSDADVGGGWMNFVGKAILSGSSSLLPAAMSDVFAQGRSFATARLSLTGIPCVVALTTVERQCRLLIASTAGYLYVYNVNTEHGGECTFLRQHNLIDDSQATGVVTTCGGATSPGSAAPTSTTAASGTAPAIAGGEQLEDTTKEPRSPFRSLRLHDESEFPPMNPGLE